MKPKLSPKSTRGAIDSHTHIYPPAFIEDVRRGRFGRTAVIEKGKGTEWIVARGKVLGKDSEVRNKLTPLYYELEPRFNDMERIGVDRIIYGTDSPADMANHQPAREIPGLSRLSEDEQRMILFGNAKKLYGV